jgi:hypothetical protein
VAEASKLKAAWLEQLQAEADSTAKPIRPPYIMKVLNEKVADDAVISLDVGENCWWFGRNFLMKRSQKMPFPASPISFPKKRNKSARSKSPSPAAPPLPVNPIKSRPVFTWQTSVCMPKKQRKPRARVNVLQSTQRRISLQRGGYP